MQKLNYLELFILFENPKDSENTVATDINAINFCIVADAIFASLFDKGFSPIFK